jgi:hypothetical protein
MCVGFLTQIHKVHKTFKNAAHQLLIYGRSFNPNSTLQVLYCVEGPATVQALVYPIHEYARRRSLTGYSVDPLSLNRILGVQSTFYLPS